MTEPRRYGDPKGEPSLGYESGHDLEAIGRHIERYWGKVDGVFHEIVSEYVHIDIHIVRATEERPYHVLVTSGMSDRPMSPPDGAEDCGYAELLIALPPEWPLDQASFSVEANYWPIRQLKSSARFPHVHQTWLWHGHTLANGDTLDPFAPDVGYCGSIIAAPVLCDEAAWQLEIGPEKRIQFFSLIPLYEEELRFAWGNRSDDLFERLGKAGVSELIGKDRANVCRP